MDVANLIDAVKASLGFDNIQLLTQGGQKIILDGALSGTPAIAKVVILPPGPIGEVTLERAHREVVDHEE